MTIRGDSNAHGGLNNNRIIYAPERQNGVTAIIHLYAYMIVCLDAYTLIILHFSFFPSECSSAVSDEKSIHLDFYFCTAVKGHLPHDVP